MEERRKDNELATFTDALLEDRAGCTEGERPPMAEVVELLARTMPTEPPPEDLRRRLRRRIRAAWKREHSGRLWQLPSLFGTRKNRWAWATAGALILVAIAAALIVPEEATQITGTVAGEAGAIALAITLGLAVALIVAWLVSRH